MKKIRWGILGCARIADNSIIPAIKKDGDSVLYALSSRNEDKLKEFASRHKPEITYNSYYDLLNDPDVDAVYIPLPNSEHYKWTLEACKRKKHVLCEKPMALSMAECTAMIKAAKDNSVILMEAFMYRYTDRIKKVSEVLNSGYLGDIRYIYASWRFFLNRVGTIKEQASLGGGSLYDVGSYPVNFLSLITDAEVETISSVMLVPEEVDTLFAGSIKYKNGIIAQISSGFNAYGRTHAEIIGDKGILIVPEPFSGEAGEIILETDKGREVITVEYSDRYYLEVSNFTSVLLNKGGALIPLDATLKNCSLLERFLKEAK